MKARIATPLALLAGLMGQSTALAQSADRPWYVGASQSFMHDSNVFGTPTGETSDTISTTSLRAGLNRPFGRQSLRLDATLSHQRYSEVSERDNNGYSLGATLDWSTIERLSGNVRVASQRRQTEFRVGGLTPISLSNIERSDDLGATVRLGVVTQLAFEAGAGHRRVSFSAPEFAAREYKQDSANLGVVYRPSGILTLSTGFSGSESRFLAPEVGQSQTDRSKRRDVYLSANWVPTGASTVDARLSYGTNEYRLATQADFEGVTGSLGWTWRPTGLLTLTTSLVRETGQEAGFRLLPGTTTTVATDFSQVTNRAALSAVYELTGKVQLQAGVSYVRRNLADASSATGRENTTQATLAARWAATRTITLGCEVVRESRTATGAVGADYDTDRYGCTGSITFD